MLFLSVVSIGNSLSVSHMIGRNVCLTCGDEGDVKLLIYCSRCHDSAVHHYCLEKFSADDNSIGWVCWDCAPKDAKVELLRKSERISVRKVRAFDVRMEWRRKLNGCKLKAKRLDKALYEANGAVQSDTTPSSFQVLQKEKPEYHETIENKDIRGQCEDVYFFEQRTESVKTGNSPVVDNHREANFSTLNKEKGGMVEKTELIADSSLQGPKCAQSLPEIEKHQVMRKPRRRFVVLDDDSDFDGEGGAVGGNISSVSDEHYIPLIFSYSEPKLASANTLPAQPVFDAIWRGCFNFRGESEISIHILAHISNKAREKVSEAAKELPVELDVKILAKRDIWPKSFQRLPPTEDSIALYLFPELEWDENTYDALLEDVIDNDLAMKATIDDLELLIFSSRDLPQKHWRFRRKYYLWGVFRHKPHPRPNIATATFIAQISRTQNAALSNPPSEVEGENMGSPQVESFRSPLSTLNGCMNSGNPQGQCFSSPLSSCCSHTSNSKESPCQPKSRLNNMVREHGLNLDAKNQDVEQHDKCRIQASDLYVSTQENAPGDEFGPRMEPFQLKKCFHLQQRGRLLAPMFL